MSELKTEITLESVRDMAPEAFRAALDRYPSDVEGALIFFWIATGLGVGTPNDADIAWATEVMKRHGR